MRISIIVPIFNMERTLKRCLESLIPRHFTNYEIILVDDGSSDDSAKIIDEYVKGNPHFKSIHKQNGGLSSARNAGMEIATGDYISFVDPDDLVEEGYLDYVSELIDGASDIIVTGVIEDILERGEIISFKFSSCSFNDITSDECLHYLENSRFLHSCFMHGKFLRKSLIINNNLRFDIVTPCEDTIFLFKFLLFAKNICFDNYQGYHYEIYPRPSLSRRLPFYEECIIINDLLWNVYKELFKKYAALSRDYKNELVSEYGIDFIPVALIDVYSNNRLSFLRRFDFLWECKRRAKAWKKEYKHIARRRKQGLIIQLLCMPFPVFIVDMLLCMFFAIKRRKKS